MPVRTFRRRNFTLVVSPGRAALMGIIEAAALMARADGQTDDAERLGLLHFLRSRGLLQDFGRQAATQAYHAELARAMPPAEALTRLERLRGQPAAALAATAAAWVAVADGLVQPAEIALLRRMRDRLGLADSHTAVRVA